MKQFTGMRGRAHGYSFDQLICLSIALHFHQFRSIINLKISKSRIRFYLCEFYFIFTFRFHLSSVCVCAVRWYCCTFARYLFKLLEKTPIQFVYRMQRCTANNKNGNSILPYNFLRCSVLGAACASAQMLFFAGWKLFIDRNAEPIFYLSFYEVILFPCIMRLK